MTGQNYQSGDRKAFAFSVQYAPNHIQSFYGRLVEYFRQEIGDEFDVIGENDFRCLKELDGLYDIVIFGNRGAAARMTDSCAFTKSLLIDHGPIHTNRAPHGTVDFEIFSSEYLRKVYSANGFAPKIAGWSGGYFLSEHLNANREIARGTCLVYLLHNTGWKANSLANVPFSDDQTVVYLNGLAAIFGCVYVVSHLNGGDNFSERYRHVLSSNVVALDHGIPFNNLICGVEAVFIEYSSVLAAALWNPRVKIFVRYPKYPCGPVTLQASFLHWLMDYATYPIREDDLTEVERILREDHLHAERCEVKDMIFDKNIDDSFKSSLDCLLEALKMCRTDRIG